MTNMPESADVMKKIAMTRNLLPYLVLDIKKYKTIPIVIQYLKGGYGAVDWGTMMAMLVLAIVPIVVFYVACQKYIIEGVVAGAVKG